MTIPRERQRKVVLVDDQLKPMEFYIDALRENNFEVLTIHDADAAVRYFDLAHEDLDAIILDIMMPAGEIFSHDDTAEGMRTGLLIYRSILIQQALLTLAGKPVHAYPIAILTNSANPQTMAELRSIHEQCAPADQFKIWHKPKQKPMEFVHQFAEWLNEVETLSVVETQAVKQRLQGLDPDMRDANKALVNGVLKLSPRSRPLVEALIAFLGRLDEAP